MSITAGQQVVERVVEFSAGDVRLVGTLRMAPGVAHPAVVVMAHGFSGVRAFCDPFAQRFAERGIATLTFDHRNFGDSDGTLRQEVEPWRQASDYSDAVTCALSQPELEGAPVGLWGTSLAGGHAIVAAANDLRVNCVVSQVPFISGRSVVRRTVRPDRLGALWELFAADRAARVAGEPPTLVPVTDPDPSAPVASPGVGCWEFLSQATAGGRSTWRNEVTLRSIENLWGYEPGAFIEHIGPRPMLMIVAQDDESTPTDDALGAFNRAREPKRLVITRGGHYDVYGSEFDSASGAAADFFAEHLRGVRG